MERKNVNRGYRKLIVWQDAIELYVLVSKLCANLPFELKKVASNTIDATHSIGRNIAEGYSRRSIKEYLIFLNYALGSCGELYTCYFSLYKAEQISKEQFEGFDKLHYKTENGLIQLIKSLQKKMKERNWEESF